MMMISLGLDSSVATGAEGSVQPSARAPSARPRIRANREDRIVRARIPSRERVLRRMNPPALAWAKPGRDAVVAVRPTSRTREALRAGARGLSDEQARAPPECGHGRSGVGDRQ